MLLWKVANDLCREFRHRWKLLVRGVSNLFDVHPFVGLCRKRSTKEVDSPVVPSVVHYLQACHGMSKKRLGIVAGMIIHLAKNASGAPKPRMSSLVIRHNSLVSHRCRFKEAIFNQQNQGNIYEIEETTISGLPTGSSTPIFSSFVTGGETPLLTRNGLGVVDDLNVVTLDLGDVIH